LFSFFPLAGHQHQQSGQHREQDLTCPLGLEKQRTRYDIECGDFDLAVGTVGWARTTDLLFHRQAL
jgi:hypothetical protein